MTPVDPAPRGFARAARGLFTLLLGAALAGPRPGWAQAAEAQIVDDAAPLEEVVVTGTRIKRRDFVSPSPLVTIEREALEYSGQPTLEEYLNQLPQMQPSQNRTANNPGDGTATLNLRGLGPERTLVTLNGRRVAPSGVGSIVDVNNLPQALVSRVEIITGGASTVYGSDALAGVVNVITRNDFVGFGVDSSYSISEEGDANVFDINLTYGFDVAGGEGNVAFFAGYYERDPMFADARELSSVVWLDNWLTGELQLYGSSVTPAGVVVFPPVDLGNGPVDRLTFNPDGSPRAFRDPEDRYNFQPTNYLQTPLTRYTTGVFATVPAPGDYEAWVEAFFVRNEARTTLAPVPVNDPFLVNTSNPLLDPDTRQIFEEQFAFAPGTAGLFFRKRLEELGPRVGDFERDYARLAAGLRGEFADGWDLDAWITYTDGSETANLLNGASYARFQQGLLVNPATGECFDPGGGCVPVDPFGAGRLSPEAVAFISVTGVANETERQQALAAASVSGNPWSTWAGPMGVALGVEWRQDDARFQADDLLFSGDVLGYNASSPVRGRERVWEVYGEAAVPLLGGDGQGHYLGLEAGARYSDYDNAGSVDTWKLGLDWRPLDTLRFRAMHQRSVRAPNMAELFTAQRTDDTLGFIFSNQDPCSASNDPAGSGNAEKCILQGLSPDQLGVFEATIGYPQRVTTGGNPDLVPEEAETTTLGFVFTPAAIEGMTLAVDWFDMQIENTIGGIDPFLICFDPLNTTNVFCDNIRRDETGNIAAVTALTSNRGLLAARGVDTQLQYVTDLPAWAGLEGGAELRIGSIWTHMISNETQDNPVTEVYDCAGYFGGPCRTFFGQSFPQDRVLTNFDYRSGPWFARLSWQWIEGMRNAGPFNSADFGFPDPRLAVPTVPDVHYFDLGLGWRPGDQLELRLVVNNLFDKQPPNMADNVFANNTDTFLYDLFGRSYFISVAWSGGQ